MPAKPHTIIVCLLLLKAGFPDRLRAAEDIVFFENKVRPILVKRCYNCHSEEAGKRKGGLWLDRKEGWKQGGDSGPALVPGDTDQSMLLHAISYLDEDLQMPPKNRLPNEERVVLKKWIAMGAPDPRDAGMAGSVRRAAIDYEKERKKWAFRPHSSPTPPQVSNKTWSRDVLDRYILASLEERKLKPSADADPEALMRRLFYDLTGLPPTVEEVEAFAKDPTQESLEQIVDDLLTRPTFGEKWGRHWLDVARYADSNGGDRNFTYFQAWRYRNYVIDSFNQDRSYYDFIRQQLAGDLMSAENADQRHDQLVASSFLALGPKMLTERDKEKLKLDTVDEQMDTIGRGMLGLALGCARCHDHKFDPVSQQDYYAMAGILRSTQVVMGTRNGCVNVASWVEQVLPGEGPQHQELQTKVERLEMAMRMVVEKQFMNKAGGKMSLDKLPLAGVIYDEVDAERTGEWKESTYSMNRFGKNYIHDDKKDKGNKKVIFRGSLPESGVYEVRMAYNADDRRAKKVPITVEGWGEVHKLTVDQTKPPTVGGLFEPIGRFKFEKGGRVNVIIETGGTEGYVIVDALQFVAVKDIEREAMALAAVKGDGADEKSLFRMNEGQLKKELEKLIKELREGDLAMAPRDADDVGDIHLRVRGVVAKHGPKIPRNFLPILHKGEAPNIPVGQSGRLELADWITGKDNALLDRVIVNRIWHHLFGRGIVATVDDFGSLGDVPTHPDLLDRLATDFRNSGGSIKQMVRRLVLSRSYRLGTMVSEDLANADPSNELFGRQNHRRLTAEEIRDSVLFLSGRLESIPGAGTSIKYGTDLDKPMNFVKETLRTVYLPIARNNLVAELEVFDVANPDLVSGSRVATTVPTQALYLFNSEFFQNEAKVIGHAAIASSDSPEERVTGLYQKLLNRKPTTEEVSQAVAFISDISSPSDEALPDKEQAYSHLAHLLLVSTEFLFLN